MLLAALVSQRLSMNRDECIAKTCKLCSSDDIKRKYFGQVEEA